MARQLIVNADDFGRTRGVSAGIIQAHQQGIVTSATAMMNFKGAAQDLHLATAQAPKLGLGVHLVFTAGRPLLPTEWVASLIDEHGRFLSQESIQADPTRINQDELRSELKSQVTAFNNALGRMPDHLDAHHFIHLHPHLFQVYLELAESFKLPARLPIPREDGVPDRLPSIAGDVPPEMTRQIVELDRELLSAHPVKSTDHFLSSFHEQHATVEHLRQLLSSLPEGSTELMTHPGLVDEDLKKSSGYTVQREQEMAALCDSQMQAWMAELDIKLITFTEL
jgi:predicted glycoside hydrolase/deacetylase ChbG (UPF0249 family)